MLIQKMGTLTKRDSKGKLIISTKAPSKKKSTSPHKDGVKLNQPQKPHLSSKDWLILRKRLLESQLFRKPQFFSLDFEPRVDCRLSAKTRIILSIIRQLRRESYLIAGV
jgi:hypothetical protein